MPLDFPSSPTNGQAYQGYVYSTSIGAWQAKPSAQSPFYTGDTPPGNPVVGDSWFNTNDGTMYVYYNDGSSFQWVEHRSQIARNQVGLVPIVPSSINTASGSASVSVDGTVTFTGSTAISLNGVFTSAFENYRINIGGNWSSSVSGTTTAMRYRASGTDSSANLYYGQGIYQSGTGVPSSSQWSTAISYHYLPTLHSGGYGIATIDVFSPAVAVRTLAFDVQQGLNVNTGVYSAHSTLHDANTAYDGFTVLSTTTANMTGKLKVYGYN